MDHVLSPDAVKDIVAEARQAVPELSVDEVKALVGAVDPPLLVDVREKEEYRDGHLPEAISIPRGFLEMQVEEKLPDRLCHEGWHGVAYLRVLRDFELPAVAAGGLLGAKLKPVREGLEAG